MWRRGLRRGLRGAGRPVQAGMDCPNLNAFDTHKGDLHHEGQSLGALLGLHLKVVRDILSRVYKRQ